MSIRHVVTWKLASTDEVERAEQLTEISHRLQSLPARIPEILSMQVGTNVLHPDANFDVVLIADYADPDALERYAVHPAHREVAAYVRSVVAERSGVDFEF